MEAPSESIYILKKVDVVGGGWQEPAKVVSIEVTVTLLSHPII